MSRKGLLVILALILQPIIITLSATTPILTLSINQAMYTIPADGQKHPAIFVIIQDAYGNPHPIPYPLNVTLTTSDDAALSIPKTVKIGAAAYYAIVNASSTIIDTKQVEVTISAPGYQSSKATFTVKPPAGIPSAVLLTILPNLLATGIPSQADLVITIIDSYGSPTIARSDLEVSLTSSKPSIANVVTTKVKIPKGESEVRTKISANGVQGTITITASLPNLKSDSKTLIVTGPRPSQIFLWSASKLLISEPNNRLFVGLLDASQRPVKLVTPITVELFASGPSIEVPSSVTIAAGEWGKFVDIECYDIGQVKVSALAENLTATSRDINVISDPGTPITGLQLTTICQTYLADGSDTTILFLQSVDINGVPTMGLEQDISLFSSNAAIVNVNTASGGNTYTIPEGYTYKFISGKLLDQGIATISAISQYLTSSQVTVNTFLPTPDRVDIQTPPITVGSKVKGILLVTSGGIPISILKDTQILLSSSNTAIGSTDKTTALIVKKSYTTDIQVSGITPGQFTITATASGLPTSIIQMKVIETKPSTFTITYLRPIINYTSPMIIQLGTSYSQSVTYTPVKISLTSSNPETMNLPNEVTVGTEKTEAIFYITPLKEQQNTITATAPGFLSGTTQIMATKVNLVITLGNNAIFEIGKTMELKAKVTLDDVPVKGITVIWTGTSLSSNNTVTNDEGEASNTLMVRSGENRIIAAIKPSGVGFLSAEKIVTGALSTYTLQIISNQPVEIRGSGEYSYGTQVHLTAPTSPSMPGIMGILGGKYIFKQWTGNLTATSSDLFYDITGDKSPITIVAIYEPDNTMPIIVAVIIIMIIVGAVLFYYFRIRKRELPKR